jgi:hypothetical protein
MILLERPGREVQIRRVSGINFMVDERGQRTAVIIDLKRHKALWEDLYDAIMARARKGEPRESLSEVRRQLKRKRQGRLAARS